MKQLLKKAKVITILILTLSLIGCEEDDNNYPIVVAGFTYTLNEDTGAVTFINISKNANTYEWDFGDESSSTLINPVKVFPNGTYNITLKAKNVAGASDSYKDELIIGITDPDSCTAETAESISGADLNMTFMSDQTANIIEDGGDFEWIDNPDYSTVNSSCKVGKITKLGNNPWDNNQIDLDAKLDFNANLGLKIKVWSALANTEVRIKLEEIGNPDNKTEQFLTTSVTSGWEELTFPFAAADSDKFNKIVIFFDLNVENTDTYYFDDLMLYSAGGGAVCTAETAESISGADLNMTFMSDQTANIIEDGGDFEWIDNPDSDNAVNASCKVGKITKLGNNPWDNNQIDLDAKLDFNANAGLKIKVWSALANTEVRIKLEEIGNPDNKTEQFLTTSVTSGWEELTFPFAAADSDKFNKIVIFFDLNAENTDTYYFDDLMLYGAATGGVTEPTTAAPTPTEDAANVKSIFSDTYTDIAGTNLDTNWQGDLVSETVTIGGSDAIKYSNVKFIGMQLAGDTDFSDMEFLHVDIWTPDATVLEITPISPPNENLVELTPLTQGEWQSYNIPVGDFTGVDFTKILQFKIDAQKGVNPAVVYMDNLYFYKTGTVGGTCPAPPAGDLISNGDFEAGEGCWQLIQNGGTVTISNTVSSGGGTYSGQIQTGPGVNPAVKQERFAVGTYLPNTVYKVTFDIKASTPLTTGAVFKAFTFSEGVDGGTTAATQHILEGGLATVSDSWETKTYTFTSAPNADQVEGGISFLAELVCGPAGCAGVINIDNVSITLN